MHIGQQEQFESLRSHGELQRQIVDDDLLVFDLREAFGDPAEGLQKESISNLQDVGLMTS